MHKDEAIQKAKQQAEDHIKQIELKTWPLWMKEEAIMAVCQLRNELIEQIEIRYNNLGTRKF